LSRKTRTIHEFTRTNTNLVTIKSTFGAKLVVVLISGSKPLNSPRLLCGLGVSAVSWTLGNFNKPDTRCYSLIRWFVREVKLHRGDAEHAEDTQRVE